MSQLLPFAGSVRSSMHLHMVSCSSRNIIWPSPVSPKFLCILVKSYAQPLRPPTICGGASLVAQRLKRLPAMQETWVLSLGREDPLEKAMAPHSSILARKIPWTEEPGRLQSMGSQRVGQDWTTSLSLSRYVVTYQAHYGSLILPNLLDKLLGCYLTYCLVQPVSQIQVGIDDQQDQ